MNDLGNDIILHGESLQSCKRDISVFAGTIDYFDTAFQDLTFCAAARISDGKNGRVRVIEYGRDVFASLEFSSCHNSFMGMQAAEISAADFNAELLDESISAMGGLLKYKNHLLYVSPSVPYMLADKAGVRSKYTGTPSVIRMWGIMNDLYMTPADKLRCIIRKADVHVGRLFSRAAKVYNVCSTKYKLHDPMVLYSAAENIVSKYDGSAVSYDIRSDRAVIRVEVPSLGKEGFVPGVELSTCITSESATLVRATLRSSGAGSSAILSQTSFPHDAELEAMPGSFLKEADAALDVSRKLLADMGRTVTKDGFFKAFELSGLRTAIGRPNTRAYFDGIQGRLFADADVSDISGVLPDALAAADYSKDVAASHSDRVRAAAGGFVNALAG